MRPNSRLGYNVELHLYAFDDGDGQWFAEVVWYKLELNTSIVQGKTFLKKRNAGPFPTSEEAKAWCASQIEGLEPPNRPGVAADADVPERAWKYAPKNGSDPQQYMAGARFWMPDPV